MTKVLKLMAPALVAGLFAWGFWVFDPNTNGLYFKGHTTNSYDCATITRQLLAAIAAMPSPSPGASPTIKPLVVFTPCVQGEGND